MLNKIMRNSKGMNYYSLKTALKKSYLVSKKPFFYLFCLFAVLISATDASAQTKKWRYVSTAENGIRSLLNDDIKVLVNGNRSVWEKLIMTDGSSVIVLAEWDCAGRRRTPRQLFFYDAGGELTNIRKERANWLEFVPGAIGEPFYPRICSPAKPLKWARIISPGTPLRRVIRGKSTVLRIAEPGEQFEITPEGGVNGWFNIVDPETQEDYWLPGDWFETIEDKQPTKNRTVAAAAAKTTPTVGKQKQRKANAQTVKTVKGRKRANR